MRCAVFDCNANNNKRKPNVRFYSVPKHNILQKQWIHFCRRKDNFNPNTVRICSAHFTADNFERNLQFEMGKEDHPDRQQFKYRLRSYILGYNEGVLSNCANVASDDTPDLVSECTLTSTILKGITINPPCTDVYSQVDNELESFAHDGLENLAGYVCYKLGDKFPDIRVLQNKLGDEIVNGDNLLISPEYLKTHLELARNVNCGKKTNKKLFRAHPFRIRKLNKEITEFQFKKKRKYNKIVH